MSNMYACILVDVRNAEKELDIVMTWGKWLVVMCYINSPEQRAAQRVNIKSTRR